MTAGRLRTAAPGDADALAGLINGAYLVERFFVEGDRITVGEVHALMGKGSFLLAEDAGALLGCVYVEPRAERGYLGLLSVAPTQQGQGLGRALVAAAEDRFRAAGCRAVDILVVNLRTELPPFYRRLGYAETGTEPFPPGQATRPCHFIAMSKVLAAPARLLDPARRA